MKKWLLVLGLFVASEVLRVGFVLVGAWFSGVILHQFVDTNAIAVISHMASAVAYFTSALLALKAKLDLLRYFGIPGLKVILMLSGVLILGTGISTQIAVSLSLPLVEFALILAIGRLSSTLGLSSRPE